MARFPVSDHCDGERFFNPHAIAGRSAREVLQWWRTRVAVDWPETLPVQPVAPLPAVPRDAIAATFIGHSTFLIRAGARSFLTDPVFTARAGPFGRLGPRRVRAPALSIDELPAVDAVLVSHNHYDHLQPSSLRTIERRLGPLFITTLGLAAFLRGLGLRRVVELDWWQQTEVTGGARVTCVPAQHFSARSPWDRNRTLWGGFVVEIVGRRFYFTGDTGYSAQFGEIGSRFRPIDLALIPIGAYEPRWFMQPMHVNPEEAVQIHRDIGSRRSIAMHYGTFHLTDEPIDEPVERLGRACAAAEIAAGDFRAIDFGETLIV